MWKSSSMSGPSATAKPISAKMAIISSMVCMVGWTAAPAPMRRAAGSGPGARWPGRASRAAASSAAFLSFSDPVCDAVAQDVDRRPLLACARRGSSSPGSSAAPRSSRILPRAPRRARRRGRRESPAACDLRPRPRRRSSVDEIGHGTGFRLAGFGGSLDLEGGEEGGAPRGGPRIERERLSPAEPPPHPPWPCDPKPEGEKYQQKSPPASQPKGSSDRNRDEPEKDLRPGRRGPCRRWP